MNTRRQITVEIERCYVTKRKTSASCQLCRNNSEMLSAEEAALLIGCNSRAIFGWVELGWLHFTKTNEGLLRVCSKSLEKIIKIT